MEIYRLKLIEIKKNSIFELKLARPGEEGGMKLLGRELSQYDHNGNNWYESINMWFNDPCYDLSDLSNYPEDKEILQEFEELVNESGATNIQQVEFIYKLINDYIKRFEKDISELNRSVKTLFDYHP